MQTVNQASQSADDVQQTEPIALEQDALKEVAGGSAGATFANHYHYSP